MDSTLNSSKLPGLKFLELTFFFVKGFLGIKVMNIFFKFPIQYDLGC